MMEVRMFASIDGIGAMIPDMFGYLSLHKLINQSGVWSQINRTIGTVYILKGATKTVTISVDAAEVETPLERALPLPGNRDEYGTASVSIALDCCCNTKTPFTVDVSFTGGGQGGGEIEVQFVASKRC